MTFSPAESSTGTSRGRGATAPAGEDTRSVVSVSGQAIRPQPPPADDWTSRSYLELGAFPTAVPCSRLHARQLLWEWGLSGVSATAELIVSELVTNALRAAGTGARARPDDDQWQPRYIGLLIAANGRQVLIGVWDGSQDPPVPQAADPDAPSGRGLMLVGSMCAGWGFCYPADGQAPAEVRDKPGKVVWGLIGKR